MKRMLIFCFILHLCQSIAAQPDLERDAAIDVAHRGYKQFLSKCLTPAGMRNYGLTTRQSTANATLGEPIELMKLTAQRIVNYKKGSGVSGLLEKRYSYLFPVLFDGVVTMLMSVHKYTSLGHTTYEIGSLGEMWLADEIVKIQAESLPARSGKRMVIADCYEANSYVFSFPDLDNTNLSFIDLSGESSQGYGSQGDVETAVQIMERQIHEEIKKGVRN